MISWVLASASEHKESEEIRGKWQRPILPF
jgi:hypothetical protein